MLPKICNNSDFLTLIILMTQTAPGKCVYYAAGLRLSNSIPENGRSVEYTLAHRARRKPVFLKLVSSVSVFPFTRCFCVFSPIYNTF